MDYARMLSDVMKASAPHVGKEKVADYIPDLARADPNKFEFAIACTDGRVFVDCDTDRIWSIRGISNVFTPALAPSRGHDGLRQRAHRELPRTPFNSRIRPEPEHGFPRDPSIDSGAIVVTDQLSHDAGDAFAQLRTLGVNGRTVTPESSAGQRNRAQTYPMVCCDTMGNPVAGTAAPQVFARDWEESGF